MHIRPNLVSFHSARRKKRMRVVILNAPSLYCDTHCFMFSYNNKKNIYIHVRALYSYYIYSMKYLEKKKEYI